MGLHHLGQVMGQVLGFGHCKESASTVSTTPDSTPSSTEGVSDETDFLEPQTAQEHSDDDLLTDSSLYWGTPRQMSLESTLSCGTPMGQPSCFLGVFPSGSSPELRGFGEETNNLGGKRPSEGDAAPRTPGRMPVPRGVVRTETIETFLAEEEDKAEDSHVNLPDLSDRVEREVASDLRDRLDWDPLQSITASENMLLYQDIQEHKASKLRLSQTEREPEATGILKGNSELELLSGEGSGDWEDREIPEVQSVEVEGQTEEGGIEEGEASNQSDSSHEEVLWLSAEAGTVLTAEGEVTSSYSALLSITEAEGMLAEVEVMEAAGDEVAADTMDTIGSMVGSIDRLVPAGALGILDAALPVGCDCCVNTHHTIGCKHSLALVAAPNAYQTQEVTEEETYSDNWQSPQQPSALEPTDHPKSQDLETIDQTATDLLYWEDVKKTGTVFGAIILILFSLTQFSGISVLAYLTLSVLSVTISLRLYTSVLHLLYKTQETHPFQAYLDLDINLTQEQLRRYSEISVYHVTSAVTHLRRLFLVEDLLDSLKFGVLLWLMTYVGTIFNGLTLTILVAVAVFIIPLVYRKHKVHINQYLGLVRGHIKDFTTKIQSKLPGSKPKAE